MMGWISQLFSKSKSSEKKHYAGWSDVTHIVVLFDRFEDAVSSISKKWISEGKQVTMIHWKSPVPKKELRSKFFTEKDIRFGKLVNPKYQKVWDQGLLIDCTKSTHKRLQRLINQSNFDFVAGMNQQHEPHYDLFVPVVKNKFDLSLNTLETYIKIINSKQQTVSS